MVGVDPLRQARLHRVDQLVVLRHPLLSQHHLFLGEAPGSFDRRHPHLVRRDDSTRDFPLDRDQFEVVGDVQQDPLVTLEN